MISDSWNRIEAWAQTHAPKMLEDLGPGASGEEIAALESGLGLSLPADLRESLQIHNGETDGWPCKVFADCGAYLGTERILEAWAQRKEITEQMEDSEDDPQDRDQLIRDGIIVVEGPVRAEMFRREWIPVMDCNGDVFWAVDLAPAEGGQVGQLIEVDWESCSWRVVADSFADFLEQYANRLEAGSYRIVEGLPTLQ